MSGFQWLQPESPGDVNGSGTTDSAHGRYSPDNLFSIIKSLLETSKWIVKKYIQRFLRKFDYTRKFHKFVIAYNL